MKKIIIFVLAAAMGLSFTACGETNQNTQETSSASSVVSEVSYTELPDDWQPVSLEAETVELDHSPYMDYLSGDWYGTVQDVVICFTLSADGTFVLSVPGLAEETVEGSWNFENGQLLLNGDVNQEVLVMEDYLYWPELDINMLREKPETYIPGEVQTDVSEEDFTGYWVSLYADLEGYIIPAHLIEDDTDIYLEGKWVALGGSLFGDIAREFECKDGALVYENGQGEESVKIVLQFLNDGMLKLNASMDGRDIILYLTPQVSASDMEEMAAGWTEED
ncbi:MAG: hypothetical protein IJH99_02515 [Eubacterium sp.]|nr:hypothetical protein [Eubacterium sp.]